MGDGKRVVVTVYIDKVDHDVIMDYCKNVLQGASLANMMRILTHDFATKIQRDKAGGDELDAALNDVSKRFMVQQAGK
jgi:hypothetical protein